eukprot:2627959-Rhodomonas_salina.1
MLTADVGESHLKLGERHVELGKVLSWGDETRSGSPDAGTRGLCSQRTRGATDAGRGGGQASCVTSCCSSSRRRRTNSLS